ncbi:MAG: hypothetical protein H7327_03655 [Herminiimonas sp.]|nr:hypothetical protein [Herminiimonas sp.]
MRNELIGCAVAGAWILTGCSSMAPVAATPGTSAVAQNGAQNVDYQRIAAVEAQARFQGVQVIWVKEPTIR